METPREWIFSVSGDDGVSGKNGVSGRQIDAAQGRKASVERSARALFPKE
jgi:hypothetical protein